MIIQNPSKKMKQARIGFKEIHNESCLKNCNQEKRRETTEDDLCTEAVSVIDGLPVRCVGEWAMQKIFHLIQYFSIFTTGMKTKWDGKINYIEICSGPGICINRILGEEFNGTSMCIIEHEACKYLNRAIFIDYNRRVISTLNERIQQRKIQNARAFFGDYNNPKDICRNILTETKGHGLNLVFIDPTDCSVPFSLIKSLKDALINVDFIVNFAIRTDANRNLRNTILYPEKYQIALNKYISFLGSDSFFKNQAVLDLAKNGNNMGLRQHFREAYMNSLRDIGYEYFDFKPIENYYDLVFATSHLKGIEFWKKANAIGFDGQRSLF